MCCWASWVLVFCSTDLYSGSFLGPHGLFHLFRRSYKHDGQRLPGGHEVILDLCVVGDCTWQRGVQQFNIAFFQCVYKKRSEVYLFAWHRGKGGVRACLQAGCWGWLSAGCSSSQRRRADEENEGSQPEENWGRQKYIDMTYWKNKEKWQNNVSTNETNEFDNLLKSRTGSYPGGVKGAGCKKRDATSRSAVSSVMSSLKSWAPSQRLAKRHTAPKHGCSCWRLTRPRWYV